MYVEEVTSCGYLGRKMGDVGFRGSFRKGIQTTSNQRCRFNNHYTISSHKLWI